MTENSRFGPAQEYETLRHEFLEAKRYVFERPLAITALAGIAWHNTGGSQLIALAAAIAFVTLFNLWFTVGRVESGARIAAYIQLVLEPSSEIPWTGWESSLRENRKWLIGWDNNKRGLDKYIKENLDFLE